MLINSAFMSMDTNQSPENNMTEITKDVIKKTPLTRASGLIIIVGTVILLFALAYSKIPFAQEGVSLTQAQLSGIIITDVIFMISGVVLYMLPEIIQSFMDVFQSNKKSKKKKK